MTGKTWAFEDFVEGGTIDLGAKDVTAEEIVEFAAEFDPQPMHLDEAAGKASILGGLSASGWHTCAMYMRLLCDAFLLDATLGMINIEQNGIIKIVSVAAVVFLPPTLVASIYGMNFEIMPELKWFFGYPLAVGLMVVSAVLPFWFFRRKGWL